MSKRRKETRRLRSSLACPLRHWRYASATGMRHGRGFSPSVIHSDQTFVYDRLLARMFAPGNRVLNAIEFPPRSLLPRINASDTRWRYSILRSGADLSGAALFRADLRGAPLRRKPQGRRPQGRKPHRRRPQGAQTSGAQTSPQGADLRGANLRHSDLRDADLSGADLRGADLCGANLRGAKHSTSATQTSGTRTSRAQASEDTLGSAQLTVQ